MTNVAALLCLGLGMTSSAGFAAMSLTENQTKVAQGVLEGTMNSATRVRSFKGIPFAQPPVGSLRWRPPAPPANWDGVRKAMKFGPRAMQRDIFGDMVFRSDGVSEDCLYLNVWTPAKSGNQRLPVLVYFYGGGFQAGDGSEPRYDGESIAARGIVAVTVNYRLNVFGFFAHPELSQESPDHASGNYGLLDQQAALRWVAQNIHAFGGDPKRVTIAGESAGSISVSAQMVAPGSLGLFAGAIGESGSLLGTLTPTSLADAEASGLKFATNNGAKALADLRALPANQILEWTGKPGAPWFSLTIDGLFLPEDPFKVFGSGRQAKVPLLVGWNSEEMNYRAVLGQQPPTVENFENALKKLYPSDWRQALQVYAPANANDVEPAATDLAGDRFIGFSTWKWADLHRTTSGKPVYRYYYAQPRPAPKSDKSGARAHGAVHSAEIEYALGNLAGNSVFAWTPEDYEVSRIMESYFANFIRTGNPNGKGLPKWPPLSKTEAVSFMRLDLHPSAQVDRHADRYRFLDQVRSH